MVNKLIKFRTNKVADADVEWHRLNKEKRDNKLYKLIGMKGGGRLLEVYQAGGEERARELIQEEFIKFLYNTNGECHMISKAEYVQWRAACLLGEGLQTNGNGLATNGSNGTSHLRNDDFGKAPAITDDLQWLEQLQFQEHPACWDLYHRGAYGETALHLCYQNATPDHVAIAKIMLSLFPKLATDIYEGETYYGQSAIHLAIVNGDFESVRLLVENGANIEQKASGNFFWPEDIRLGGKQRATTYKGFAYFGEYPLAFAACFEHKDIYDYLIEHGADPNKQDFLGNTVLHMLVVNNKAAMYIYVTKHYSKRPDQQLENSNGYNSLTLASKLGMTEIFRQIIEIESVELWRYSNISCSVYPIDSLDSIADQGATSWQSALIITIEGGTDEHLDLLEGGAIRQLLDEKWKTFAHSRFLTMFFWAILHLICLSVAIYLRPISQCPSSGVKTLQTCAVPLQLATTDAKYVIRYIAEILVTLSCFATIVMQLRQIKQLHRGYIKCLSIAPPAYTIFLVACLLILACVPLRISQSTIAENHLLAIAVPMSWAYLLFFFGGIKLTGPFVTMIYKMCAGDMVRFGSIYVIFLLGFGLAFFTLFRDTDVDAFATPLDTLKTLFHMTLNEFDYGWMQQAKYPLLAKLVFVLYLLLMAILLLNMLIAMMANTYLQVIRKSTKEWRRHWAKIVVVLERSFTPNKLVHFREEYSLKFPGPGKRDPETGKVTDRRGLMVIRQLNKTRASQRLSAMNNWKLIGRQVLNMVKSYRLHNQAFSNNAPSATPLTIGILLDHNRELKKRKRPGKAQEANLGRAELNNNLIDVLSNDRAASAKAGGLTLQTALEHLAWQNDINLGNAIAANRLIMSPTSNNGKAAETNEKAQSAN